MHEINVVLTKSITKLTISCFFIFIFYIQSTTASAKKCDFEKSFTGCFNQANFVCDRETNLCKCHPETPVMIDQRFCLKRAKTNEICQFNEQCDNANGFYCTYSDYKLVNSSESSRKNPSRCRLLKMKYNNSSKYSPFSSSSSLYQQQQQESDKVRSTNGMSNFQACIWAFLIACLFLLITLLLLIKSHYQGIGESRPPFQQAEDDLSINSEIDVPPPYEVAIRMKL